MRHSNLLNLFWMVAAGVIAATSAQGSQADNDIRMWEMKAARDPEDGVSRSNLGTAYIQKARESGDYTYYKKAEEVLCLAMALTPNYRAAMMSLAATYNSQHRFRESIQLMRQVVAMKDDKLSKGVLGDALFELGQVDEAEKLYNELFEATQSPFSYTRKANVQILRGDNAGALKSLNLAIESGTEMAAPQETLAWCETQIGALYFSSGDFDRAQTHYDAAIKIFPDYHQALDRVAELQGARGNYDEAVAIYLKLIERTPRPDLQEALGALYQYRGMKTEAQRWYDKAFAGYRKACDEGNSHFFHHLAGYYCDIQENPAEALKWAQKDLDLRQNIYAHDTLSWALYKNGKFNEAAAEMTKALALGTKDAHLLFHAGLVYSRSGDFAKGRECTAKALSTNPAFEKFHVHR